MKTNFLDGERFCLDLDGHLASISNSADNLIVQNGAVEHFKGDRADFWLGANNLEDFATWKWTDKSGFGFSNWAAGESEQFDHNCAAGSQLNGKWKPAPCFDLKAYVCELPAELITTCPPTPTCAPETTSCPECPTRAPCPTLPPTQPPTQPPTNPPSKPPTQPTTQPPTQPPTLALTTSTETLQPPTNPPSKPPTQPRTQPPTLAPTTSPETTQPPTNPPSKPPTQPPTQPPTLAPTTSPETTQPQTNPPSKPAKPPTKPPPPGCVPSPCGARAHCYVQSGVTTCLCRAGTTGNPFTGCGVKTSTAQAVGDPHYTTFDGTSYDYYGLCPYIFSQPCNMSTDDSHFYSVKVKNRQYAGDAYGVSWVEEIEVTMAEQKIFVSEHLELLVNGITAYYPFYFPSKDDAKVSVELRGRTVYISNRDNVVVKFSQTYLYLTVPHLEEFLGRDGICGFSGNLNNDCTEDLVGRDGTTLSNSRCRYPLDVKTLKEIAVVMDSWITDDFNNWKGTCERGDKIVERLPACNVASKAAECAVIKQALTAEGPFAACQGLGKEKIENAFDNCAYDACYAPGTKCRVFQDFADTCQQELGEADLNSWRSATGCALDCAKINPFSTYHSCISGCETTCANRNSGQTCDKPCHDGCKCDAGYLLDNTQSPSKCVKADDCPCYDEQGNAVPKGLSYLRDNCSKQVACIGGVFHRETHECPSHSHCQTDENHYLACECDAGFQWNADETQCIG